MNHKSLVFASLVSLFNGHVRYCMNGMRHFAFKKIPTSSLGMVERALLDSPESPFYVRIHCTVLYHLSTINRSTLMSMRGVNGPFTIPCEPFMTLQVYDVHLLYRLYCKNCRRPTCWDFKLSISCTSLLPWETIAGPAALDGNVH